MATRPSRFPARCQADLIAVGRESLNNPNWPMDAALKLGVEGPFRNVPPQFGYWLGTRAKRGFGTHTLDLAERPRRQLPSLRANGTAHSAAR